MGLMQLFDGTDESKRLARSLFAGGMGMLANSGGQYPGASGLGKGGLIGLQEYDAIPLRDLQLQKTRAEVSEATTLSDLLKKAASGFLKKAASGLGQSPLATSVTEAAPEAAFSPSMRPQTPLSFGIGNQSPAGGSFIGAPNPYVPDGAGMPATGPIGGAGQTQQFSSGNGSSQGGANPFIPRGTGLFSPENYELLGLIKMAGGADLTDMYKFVNTPQPLKSGHVYNPRTGQMEYLDNPESGISYNPNTRTVSPLSGYAATNAANKAAETAAVERARNQYSFQEVVDANGVTRKVPTTYAVDQFYGLNPEGPQPRGVFTGPQGGGQPQAAPTGGTVPAPMRNNNPGALMPGGRLAQYPTMEEGLAALDGNLRAYGQRGINTVAGVISRWAPPNENNTQAYINAVSQRLGIRPDQQIDLGNPLVRQALSTAIALHENGVQGVFGGGTPQPATPQGGSTQPAAAPAGQPRGFVTKDPRAENLAHFTGREEARNVADRYAEINRKATLANNVLESLKVMQKIADSDPGFTRWGYQYAPDFFKNNSTAVALYDKHRANVIAQMSQGGGANTDASRANIAESIPEFSRPNEAKKSALKGLENQIRADVLRQQVLTSHYNRNDNTGFIKADSALGVHLHPEMMPFISQILQPSSAQARAEAARQLASNTGGKEVIQVLLDAGVLR